MTMTDLKTFSFSGLELRVLMEVDTPWFMAADVCEALGFCEASDQPHLRPPSLPLKPEPPGEEQA